MNWQLRDVCETWLGEGPEDCFLVSARLHAAGCNCKNCCALESTARAIGELLRPGEVRKISIEGTGLHLTIKRHSVSPKSRPGSRIGSQRVRQPDWTSLKYSSGFRH
jgi:hypothetical protein